MTMKKTKCVCSICGKEIKSENILARSASYPVDQIISLGLRPQGVNGRMGLVRTCGLDCSQRLDQLQMEKTFGGIEIHRSKTDKWGRPEIVS
jgi:hypothetical protein